MAINNMWICEKWCYYKYYGEGRLDSKGINWACQKIYIQVDTLVSVAQAVISVP